MKRYCIVCHEMFGCINGGEKHECSNCSSFNNCPYRNDSNKSHITGGICESCWQKRHAIKMTYEAGNTITS